MRLVPYQITTQQAPFGPRKCNCIKLVQVMWTRNQTPIDEKKTRIGWIGIGVMGAAMASRILSAGFNLSVYARTPSKALFLKDQGANLVSSLQSLADQSDVIFTMVGHPSDVRQIVLEKLLPCVNPGTVLVDHTSNHPLLAKEIHSASGEKGCFSVDAPVSGGDIGAKEGKLAIFAGGDEGVVNWLKPLFELIGKVTYVGSAGKGQSCKIANQISVGANLLGLSEGLVFTEKAGLDKAKFLEAVRGGAAGSMVMELFGGRMIERDFKAGGFVEYMVKDMGMGVNVGEEENGEVVVLPGASLGKQLFSGMVANGNGKMGTQGLITIIEKLKGK